MNNHNQEISAQMINELIKIAYNLGKQVGVSRAKMMKGTVNESIQEIQNEIDGIYRDRDAYGESVVRNANKLLSSEDLFQEKEPVLVNELFSSPASAVLTQEEKKKMFDILKDEERLSMKLVTKDGEEFLIDFNRTDEEVLKLCKEDFKLSNEVTIAFLQKFKDEKKSYFENFGNVITGDSHV